MFMECPVSGCGKLIAWCKFITHKIECQQQQQQQQQKVRDELVRDCERHHEGQLRKPTTVIFGAGASA